MASPSTSRRVTTVSRYSMRPLPTRAERNIPLVVAGGEADSSAGLGCINGVARDRQAVIAESYERGVGDPPVEFDRYPHCSFPRPVLRRWDLSSKVTSRDLISISRSTSERRASALYSGAGVSPAAS